MKILKKQKKKRQEWVSDGQSQRTCCTLNDAVLGDGQRTCSLVFAETCFC